MTEQEKEELSRSFSKILILTDSLEQYLTSNNWKLKESLKHKMNKYLRATTNARKTLEEHYAKPSHADIMGDDSDNFIEKIDQMLEDL